MSELPKCGYRKPASELYQCSHHRVLGIGEANIVTTRVCARCQYAEAKATDPRIGLPLPPLNIRLANFAKAVKQHQAAGAPKATQQQIDERLEICRACELFKPNETDPSVGYCTHIKCGCNLSREQKFLNKLAFADQECPEGKWGRVD